MKSIDEKYFATSALAENPTEMKNFVAENEDILWSAKPKKSAYILSAVFNMLPFVLIWLVVDGAFIALMYLTGLFDMLPTWGIALIGVFFALHLIPVWFWIFNVLKALKSHKNLEYAFTGTRVIVKSGTVYIDFKALPYSEIESVNLKVGFSDKLTKVGDVYVRSKNNTLVLFDVENPYLIVRQLQKAVMDVKESIDCN